MKNSTKLVSRFTVLCGTVLLASTSLAHSSYATETSALNNVTGTTTVLIESDLDQVDPLVMSVAPFFYNGGVNIRCFGQNSGRATATTTGGVAPYTYSWSFNNTITGNLAIGMTAGTYSVTVTDAAGSSVTQSFTLIQNPPIQTVLTETGILCYGGTSDVTISAIGGTLPYNGTATYTVNPGTYSYLVADANGCRNTASITVTQPDILEISATPTAIACWGETSQVTVSGTGGTLPYTGAGTFTEVAGVYTYAITDANGCTDNTVLAINQPSKLTAAASATPIACYGGTSQVAISVISGTEPYSGNGLFTETAGTYTYMVYDYNLCSDEITVTVDQPSAMSTTVSATPIACAGGTTTISVTGSGGTGIWSGTGTFVRPAGTYNYALLDANGCTDYASITVAQPTQLVASISATPITCNGGTSTVTINATGGTAPYTGNGTFTVGAGTHTFTVTDANGCSVNVSKTVNAPSPVVVTAAATSSIQCYGQTTSVLVSATGGSAPYTGTGVISNVPGGTATYTVVDSKGCSASVNYTVSGGSQIIPNVSPTYYIADCIPHPIVIQASPTGGTAPYTYLWSNGATTSSISVNPGSTTIYNVTITDANGCSVTTNPNGATVEVLNRCGNNNQKIVICHVPSGTDNPQTICISPNALDPHMSNAWNLHGGDYCGPCQSTMALTLDEENNGDNNFVSVGLNTNTETVDVSYRLSYDSDVRIEIYDMTGALVEMIHQNNAVEGELYNFVISPSKFTTGVYIYQFITDVERHIDKLHFIH